MKDTEHMRKELISCVRGQIEENDPAFVKEVYETLLEQGYEEEETVTNMAAALAYALSMSVYYENDSLTEYYQNSLEKLVRDEDLFDHIDESEWDEELDEEEMEDEIPESLWQKLLRSHTDSELEEIARQMDISTKDCTEASLAMRIADALLNDDVMYLTFSELHEDLADHMDELMQKGSIPFSDALYDELMNDEVIRDYLYFSFDGNVYATNDVRQAYLRMLTPEFIDERRKRCWMGDVIQTFIYMYGAGPAELFTEMYNSHPQLSMSEDKILDFLLAPKKNDRVLDLVNGKLIFTGLLKKKYYRKLEKEQGNHPYEILSYEEIASLGKHMYPANDPAYQKMNAWLQERREFLGLISSELMQNLFSVFNAGGTLAEAAGEILIAHPGFTQQEWKECIGLLEGLCESTRCILYRGAPLHHQVSDEEAQAVLQMAVKNDLGMWPEDA